MATVQLVKNKDGTESYKVSVSLGYDITGKRIRKTATLPLDPKLSAKQQEKVLKEFVTDFEMKVKGNKIYDGENMAFYEFVCRWVEDYAKQTLEPSTIMSYAMYLDHHIVPYFGHYKLSEIKPFHIMEFYTHLQKDGVRNDGKSGGYSAKTIKKYHAILSSVLSCAYRWELIESNPCEKVTPPKSTESSKVKCFTLEQAELFLNALDMDFEYGYRSHIRTMPNGQKVPVKGHIEYRKLPLQFKVFFYMALFGGFRREELISATWDTIDLVNCTFSVESATGLSNKGMYEKSTKNQGSKRLVSLPSVVIELLQEYKEEWEAYKIKLGELWVGDNKDYLFIQERGQQMYISTPTHVFANVIKRYNTTADEDKKLPQISLHGLRHTHASLLICNNTDVRTVASRLGHSTPNVTLQVYSHAFRKADETAANKMEEMFNIHKGKNSK